MQALNKKTALSKVAFSCAVALFLAISFLYLRNIYEWKDYPDFGYGFGTATGIDVVRVVTDHGRRAGLRVGDRILKVNGRTFRDISEFRSAMERELRDKNTYLIERQGQRFEVTVTNVPAGLGRALGASGLPYLVGLCYALIGTLVFLMKPHRRTSWIFFLLATTFGLFLTFLYKLGVIQPFWLESLIIFTYTFLPAALIHLSFCFPEERGLVKKYPLAQLLPYFASALLFLCTLCVTPTITDTPTTWLVLVMVYLAFAVLSFLASCFQLYLTTTSEIVKLRSKMILLGAAISASLPLLDFIINTLFRIYLLPGFNYYLPFFIVFPLFIGYSIIKHDLFDIDAIIKRTYGYVLTTGAIAGTYALFTLLSNIAFGQLEISRSPLFPLVFVLTVVFLFNPVRNRAQRFIDRVFYRLEYDYRETVERISETMRSLLKLDQIVKSIMDTALGVMFIESGSLLLLNRERLAYEGIGFGGEKARTSGVTRPESRDSQETQEPDAGDLRRDGLDLQAPVAAESQTVVREDIDDPGETAKSEPLPELRLPADAPFIERLAERKREVTVYDIQEDPFFAEHRDNCLRLFEQLEAILIVPLIYENRLIGLISLGGKKSGKFYRREDINLLRTLANQGAVAIENAILLEEMIEKERMEEELAIARDLQMSMLPTACPEVEGFEIAALSMQAREVGGDFYDFIEIGDGKVGLVVGDVTGKSVSGALVMSAARSVFRMLSEEELSVGEIMMRANRRTKQDIKSGMFVALLFAVVDGKERTLSLCSAGQTQPIHLCAETVQARLVETEGDNFPLGIVEEADYLETRLQLAVGDRVVFYTDGIVEAMNEQGEMFGFERLIEAVQGAESLTADSLLKEVTDRVKTFVGGAPQSDDLTVIVLSVAE